MSNGAAAYLLAVTGSGNGEEGGRSADFVSFNPEGTDLSATTVQAMGVELSSKITTMKTAHKRLNLQLIEGSYVDNTTGEITEYAGWWRTPYIEIPNTKQFTFSMDSTYNNKYNCFYDSSKNFISAFTVHKGDIESVAIPANAKYVIFSSNWNFMANFTVDYDEVSMIGLADNIAQQPTLKFMSFNVGMWNDGTTGGVPAAEVEAKSANYHKLLGEVNPDIVAIEEGLLHFDRNDTVLAYDKLFRFKYAWKWIDTNTTHSLSTKEAMMFGRYPISNVHVHAFASGSNRAFITYDIQFCGKTIHCILCHLSFEEELDGDRSADMDELAALMATYDYGILSGDFNVFNTSEFDTHFSDFNMASHGAFGDYQTWRNPTTAWPNGCLDNIITTKSITIQNVSMPNVELSDHKPLFAELTLS